MNIFFSFKRLRGAFATLLIVAMFVAGCATKILATKESDLEAKAFNPPGDRAYIYVIRHSTIVGNAVDITIDLNGKRTGGIQNGTYAMYDVHPGAHTFVMGILRPNPTPTEDFFVPATLELSTQPGRVYFITGRLRNEGPEIRVLPEPEGKRMLLEEGFERVVINY